LIDSGLIDSGLIDVHLNDSGLIDSGLIDSGLIDSGLIDSGLIDSGLISDSFSSATKRSILALSAQPGNAREQIFRYTFDQVGGALVRVDRDSRVSVAHQQADGSVACPYAQNLIAAEIKRIIDSYRFNADGSARNPITDVVIVGPDSGIPFWRMVDPKLAQE